MYCGLIIIIGEIVETTPPVGSVVKCHRRILLQPHWVKRSSPLYNSLHFPILVSTAHNEGVLRRS